jgi:hypothetical protein
MLLNILIINKPAINLKGNLENEWKGTFMININRNPFSRPALSNLLVENSSSIRMADNKEHTNM